MVAAFDPRIVKVSLQLAGELLVFTDLNIYASGQMLITPEPGHCDCHIFNLTRQQKNNLISQASPFKRNSIPMTIDVGRESYGTFRLFDGNVFAGVSSQPPDIGITLSSLVNYVGMGNVTSNSHAPLTLLSKIAQAVATINKLQLKFEATDKQIDCFSFTGAAAKLVDEIAMAGGVDVWVQNGQLIVKDAKVPLKGDVVIISAATGMIGIPEVTVFGARVKVMMNSAIRLGGAVQIISDVNPAANAVYNAIRINFEVSNRDQPFWYIIDCQSSEYFSGTVS